MNPTKLQASKVFQKTNTIYTRKYKDFYIKVHAYANLL